MKLAIVTLLYRRPELAKIVLDHYSYTFSEATKIAVYSPGDMQLTTDVGWKYCQFPNAVLAQKFNHAFQQAKAFNPDAVILTGSSTVLSKELIDYYQGHYAANADYVLGLKDIYLINRKDNRLIHWKGMDSVYDGLPVGSGRIYSRFALDKLNWRPYGDLDVPRGLDTNSSVYMSSQGIESRSVTMAEAGIALDIKDTETMNPFEAWLRNGELIDNAIAFERFPLIMRRMRPSDRSQFISGQKLWVKVVATAANGKQLPWTEGQYVEMEGDFAFGLYRNNIVKPATADEIVEAETLKAQTEVIAIEQTPPLTHDDLMKYVAEDSETKRVYLIPADMDSNEVVSELSQYYASMQVGIVDDKKKVTCIKHEQAVKQVNE